MHTAARRGREEHRGGRPISEAELPALQERALASLGTEDLVRVRIRVRVRVRARARVRVRVRVRVAVRVRV